MNVIKRDGSKEEVSFDKVKNRIKLLSSDLRSVNPFVVAQKVCSQIYNDVKTSELDELAARICASMITDKLEYGELASRIIISNNHKNTSPSFTETIEILRSNVDPIGNLHPLIDDEVYATIKKYSKKINAVIDYNKDYLFDFFAYKTLEKSYLLKVNGIIIERPQHMFMRVSLGLWKDDIKRAINCYKLISQKYFTQASPTLYHSGTPRPQNASCFLIGTDDSIEGIFKTITDCAKISKWAGGIGIHISNIRSKGQYIRKTNGYTDGIIPMLKVYNDTARYINQSSRRPGSIAVYLEPHHPDIMDFLELKLNNGHDNVRARDLFLAVWISDLFMKCVENDDDWYLLDPDMCPNLTEVYGKEYEELYWKYVDENKYTNKIKAREVFIKMIKSQIETGIPYVSFKDAVNKKSNQQNIGTIKSSNLCVAPETMILTRNGYYPINELENKEIEVWNGHEFSKTTVYKTGKDQELMKIKFSNGSTIECTPYHKFYTTEGTVEAQNLKLNDKIIKHELPIIDNKNNDFKYPYTHGFFCGDGCYGRNTKYNSTHNKLNVYIPRDINHKFDVPINYSLDVKLKWFAGLCDSDGYVYNNKGTQSIKIASIHKELLKNVMYMLQTIGINSKIQLMKKEEFRNLPDSNKKLKPYYCKTSYRLLISSYYTSKLLELGLVTYRLQFNNKSIQRNSSQFNYVTKIKFTKRISDTYCFNEPLRHSGIFNGIITGNCNEINLVSNDKEYAVCVLGSLCLPKFIENNEFNHELLINVIDQTARNLNQIIDYNFYPVPETRLSNKKHRPLGQGVQGLADVYSLLKLPYDSDKAMKLNIEIFETIYYGMVLASMKMAKERYKDMKMLCELWQSDSNEIRKIDDYTFESDDPKINKLLKKHYVCIWELEMKSNYGAYSSFIGSPMSEGKFQFDLWNITPSDRHNWDKLRKDVIKWGIRNSTLTAIMPTASTAQIMGNNEACEPYTSNIYSRSTIAGTFTIINKHMVRDLMERDLWNKQIKNKIIATDGDLSSIDEIPDDIKNLYKTSFELKQKTIIDQAIGRAPYICQTQSMNLFFTEPTIKLLSSALFYAWKGGLKTGSYYIRSRPKVTNQKFTIEPEVCESCSG